MTLLSVAVVTPEGAAFEGNAKSVVVPGADGEFAFLPGHAPFVGTLGYGDLRLTDMQDSVRHFFLAGGVVQVADNEVTILAEHVEEGEKVDPELAERELAEAMHLAKQLDMDIETRQAAIDKARAKLRVARGG